MLAGVSTACFYPQYTEEALKEIATLSIQAVEIFINCGCELEYSFLRELRNITDSSGIQILSVHPYTSGMETMLFFAKYKRRNEEGRELYKRYYEAAQILGADIVVFHGCARQYKVSRDEYFERFGILLQDAKTQGVSLCQENVARCKSYSVDFLRDMKFALPDAKFVLDIKQVMRSEGKVEDFIDAIGNQVAHIHISDHDSSEYCMPPGKGVFNTKKFLKNMQKKGFDGGVIVELYRDNFDTVVELKAGYQHVLASFPQRRIMTK